MLRLLLPNPLVTGRELDGLVFLKDLCELVGLTMLVVLVVAAVGVTVERLVVDDTLDGRDVLVVVVVVRVVTRVLYDVDGTLLYEWYVLG